MTATGSRNGRTVPNDPAELRQEIARTRAELGETVEALAARADVKARAQETMAAAKLRVREGVQQAAVNAAYAGRELRAHPGQQLELALVRLRRSARENSTQWAVMVGLILLSAFVVGRRRQR